MRLSIRFAALFSAFLLMSGMRAFAQEPGPVAMFVSSQQNQIYVFGVTPASGSLQTVYSDSALHQPIGLALSSSGDLFVINSGEPQAVGSGSVARYAVTGYTLAFQNTFGSGQLSDPFWGDFRGDELLIAQAQGNTVERFTIAPDGSASFNGTFGSFQTPMHAGSPSVLMARSTSPNAAAPTACRASSHQGPVSF